MKNDQPDYNPVVPGLGHFNPQADGMSSPGSSGIGFNPENLSSLGTVPVSNIYDHNGPDTPMVTVDAGDASVPSQVALFDQPSNAIFGGVTINSGGQGPTQPGAGSVIGDHHPGH